jgi:hypothetical protein
MSAGDFAVTGVLDFGIVAQPDRCDLEDWPKTPTAESSAAQQVKESYTMLLWDLRRVDFGECWPTTGAGGPGELLVYSYGK